MEKVNYTTTTTTTTTTIITIATLHLSINFSLLFELLSLAQIHFTFA